MGALRPGLPHNNRSASDLQSSGSVPVPPELLRRTDIVIHYNELFDREESKTKCTRRLWKRSD